VQAQLSGMAPRSNRLNTNKNIYHPTSLRLSIINWWHVAMIYVQPVAIGLLAIGVAVAASRGLLVWSSLTSVLIAAQSHVTANAILYVLFGVSLGALFLRRRNPVYLVDFATFKPPASWRVTHEDIIKILETVHDFAPESIDFSKRILARSATGQVCGVCGCRCCGVDVVTSPVCDDPEFS